MQTLNSYLPAHVAPRHRRNMGLTATLPALLCAFLALAAPRSAQAQDFSSDTFTGTAGTLLTAHTGELGATWTALPDEAANLLTLSSTGTLYTAAPTMGTAGLADAVASGSPPSADYTVQADLVIKSSPGSSYGFQVAGIGLRATTDGLNRYTASYNAFAGTVELSKVVAGSTTLLASVPELVSVGQTYHLSLTAVGSALYVFWAGTQALQVTDGSLTAAGRAEVQESVAGTDGGGIQIDNFEAGVTPTPSGPGLLGQPVEQDFIRTFRSPGDYRPNGLVPQSANGRLIGRSQSILDIRTGTVSAGGLTLPTLLPVVTTQILPTQIIIQVSGSGSVGSFSGSGMTLFNGLHLFQTGIFPKTIQQVQVDGATTFPLGASRILSPSFIGASDPRVTFDAKNIYVDFGTDYSPFVPGSVLVLDVQTN